MAAWKRAGRGTAAALVVLVLLAAPLETAALPAVAMPRRILRVTTPESNSTALESSSRGLNATAAAPAADTTAAAAPIPGDAWVSLNWTRSGSTDGNDGAVATPAATPAPAPAPAEADADKDGEQPVPKRTAGAEPAAQGGRIEPAPMLPYVEDDGNSTDEQPAGAPAPAPEPEEPETEQAAAASPAPAAQPNAPAPAPAPAAEASPPASPAPVVPTPAPAPAPSSPPPVVPIEPTNPAGGTDPGDGSGDGTSAPPPAPVPSPPSPPPPARPKPTKPGKPAITPPTDATDGTAKDPGTSPGTVPVDPWSSPAPDTTGGTGASTGGDGSSGGGTPLPPADGSGGTPAPVLPVTPAQAGGAGIASDGSTATSTDTPAQGEASGGTPAAAGGTPTPGAATSPSSPAGTTSGTGSSASGAGDGSTATDGSTPLTPPPSEKPVTYTDPRTGEVVTRQWTWDARAQEWRLRAVQPEEDGSSVNVGAIVGGTLAGVAALAAAGGFVWYRRRRRAVQGAAPPGADPADGGKGAQAVSPSPDQPSPGSGSPSAMGDGVQDLAALWGAAAQQGAPAGGVPLIRFGSSPTDRGTPDVLLSWVTSQLQQGKAAGAAPPPAEGAHTPPGSARALVPLPPSSPSPPSSARGSPSPPASARSSSGELLSSAASRRSSLATQALAPWEVDFDELRIVRPLGEGSYGRVYLATHRETPVAVKLLLSAEDAAAAAKSSDSVLSLSSPVMQELQKECGLMASLRHPNVVLFLGMTYQPPAIITEYCARGSLFDVLHAAQGGEAAAAQLSWPRRVNMALDAAKGMLALHAHSPPILHRDLKSPNLLVDAAWRVKVCDFNLSRLLEDSTRSSSVGGMLNPRWLAPEVLVGGSATAKSDVFSFGVVMWELMTWQTPWERDQKNAFQLVFMVSEGQRLAVPAREAVAGATPEPHLYDRYVALMARCWAQAPADRPEFEEIIQELRAMSARAHGASSSSSLLGSNPGTPAARRGTTPRTPAAGAAAALPFKQ